MKRFFLALIAAAGLAIAQEHAATPPQEHAAAEGKHASTEAEHQDGDPLLMWKWINFAILAGVLGYLIGKQAPPFFKARNESIQRDLAESRRMRAEAETRAAEMERRLASLGSEVERLRGEASRQMAQEGDRIRRETEQAIARVQNSSEQEIDSIAKHATAALRAEAADLAVRLAEQRVRESMGPDTQAGLIDRFVRGLDSKGARN